MARIWRSMGYWTCLSFIVTGLFVLATALLRHPAITPDYLGAKFPGFTAAQLPAPEPALVVTSLRSDSEAIQNGIAVGDKVLAIDGLPIQSRGQAENLLRHDSDPTLEVSLLHDGPARDVILHRAERPAHGS